MGNDNFPSGASVTMVAPGLGGFSDNVTLNGPTTVHRNDPCVGCGPGGRTTINTEMLQMDLTGNVSSAFGPVHFRESPSRPSLGQIRQQTPGVDFPADSFFDIFFEIDTPIGTFHNEQPLHMQAVIDAIPPISSQHQSAGADSAVHQSGASPWAPLQRGARCAGHRRDLRHQNQSSRFDANTHTHTNTSKSNTDTT